jgi:spore germination protein YaaH
MNKYTSPIIWVTIFALVATIFVPATPVFASSLGDILGQSSGPDNSGKGIVDLLLGLLLGNLFNKFTHGTSGSGSTTGLPNSYLGSKEVMGFYAEWYGNDTASYTSMAQNTDTLKTIIPFWTTLQADGSVSDRGGNDHASVVKFAHQNNMKALLMVNNAKQDDSNPPIHTVLANPALRKTAIDNLEAYIKKYNLDGVNIDFEMVPSGDKNNLTAFMRELSARLKPQGYIISIDVFPKTDESNDVSVAYDFSQLPNYADRIIIMAYDNHGVWSGPGPIADINWVENNLQYALKFIPKNKLYLGIAGYGYDWSTKGVESLEYSATQNLINKFGSAVKWDDQSKSPYFNYTGSDGVSHTVWYENSNSLKAKLDIVNKYDIAGVAIWRLGGEDPGYWQVFKDKLK